MLLRKNNLKKILKQVSLVLILTGLFVSCDPENAFQQDLNQWKDKGLVSNYFSGTYPLNVTVSFDSIYENENILCGFSLSKEISEKDLDKEALSPNKEGVYFLHVKIEGKTETWLTRKVVVTDNFSLKEVEDASRKKLRLNRLMGFRDEQIVQWAWKDVDYSPGEGSDLDAYKDPKKALGPASGISTDVLCLGNGGSVIVEFEKAVADLPGPDICVFENGIEVFANGKRLLFAELAFVEVSSNGKDFVRFPNVCLDSSKKGPFENVDPKSYHGLAGISKIGEGLLFDLADLICTEEVARGDVDLDNIRFVKIIDIPGNADSESDFACFDSFGNLITDPYKTEQTAGFDLDGIGALNAKK